MPVLKPLFIVLACTLFSVSTFAQQAKPAKPKEAPVQKYKPVKLKTSLGTRSDSIATLTADEVLQLIELPIIVTDDKKSIFTIASYQCMYKRKGVTEDEETGKVSPTTSVVAQLFKTTPLPEVWKRIITEQLKSGEEIFFFDVVAKDAAGHLMFAPSIKFVIK